MVKAFDEKLHRMVAIKIMSPRLAATSPARKRFIREARSSAAIRHENVVNIHAIEEQPIPFLVMEYVAGETLQQRLDRTGPLDPTDVLRIGVQIARGLAAAHAMGRIHRDIKPANILLESGVDRVKITDFGRARAADDASLTQSGYIAGTPMYMAPEQAQGIVIDHRADLFSFGSVLYVMCSGRPPFRASTTLAVLKRVTEDTPRPIHEIIPEVPEWLCNIITKLHAKKPEARFGSAQEVANLLGAHLTKLQQIGQPTASSRQPASTIKRVAPERRKGIWIAVVAALVVVVLLGLGLTEATDVTNLRGAVMQMFPAERRVIVAVDAPDTRPPAPGDPDRRAAEWVVSVGGRVHVNDLGHVLSASADLPGGTFRLTNVNLVGSKRLTDGAMAQFKACTNVTQLELTNTNVSDDGLAYFKDCRYLTGLGFGGTQVSDVGLAHFKDCKRVVRLDLDGTLVTDAGLALFKDCKNLGTVAVAKTTIGDLGLAHLKDCKNLTILELSHTNVSDAGLAHLKDCKHLTYLGLAGAKVGDAGLKRIGGFTKLASVNVKGTKVSAAGVRNLSFALPTCKIEWDGGMLQVTASSDPDRGGVEYALAIGGETVIREWRGGKPGFEWTQQAVWDSKHLTPGKFEIQLLDLSQIAHVSDTGLALFKGCKRIQALALNGTAVSDAGLAPFKDCSFLQGLDLDGTQISDDGLAHFTNLRSLTGLGLTATNVTDAGLAHVKDCNVFTRLELGGTRVTDAGLAHFKRSRGLAHVGLARTEIGDAGLAQLASFKQLAVVELGHTKVSNAGLAHLKDCKNLATLDLQHTQVGDAGLAHLKNCQALSHVVLANTRLSDDGLALLAGFPKLLLVNVKSTDVTEAGVKKFAAALPTCKVEWSGGVMEPTIEADPVRRGKEWLLSKPRHRDRCAFIDEKEFWVYRLEGLPMSPPDLRVGTISRQPAAATDPLALLKLQQHRHLTHMYVRNPNVADAALMNLKDYKRLRELHLSGTAVTDAGLARLTGLSELRYLNLKNTAVTEGPLKTLNAALPNCKIEWNGGVFGPTTPPGPPSGGN